MLQSFQEISEMEGQAFQTALDVSTLKTIRIVENEQLDIAPLITNHFLITNVINMIK